MLRDTHSEAGMDYLWLHELTQCRYLLTRALHSAVVFSGNRTTIVIFSSFSISLAVRQSNWWKNRKLTISWPSYMYGDEEVDAPFLPIGAFFLWNLRLSVVVHSCFRHVNCHSATIGIAIATEFWHRDQAKSRHFWQKSSFFLCVWMFVSLFQVALPLK